MLIFGRRLTLTQTLKSCTKQAMAITAGNLSNKKRRTYASRGPKGCSRHFKLGQYRKPRIARQNSSRRSRPSQPIWSRRIQDFEPIRMLFIMKCGPYSLLVCASILFTRFFGPNCCKQRTEADVKWVPEQVVRYR